MKNFLVNVIHFEAPEAPITMSVFLKVAFILAKEFPVISSLFGLVLLFAIVQFFRLKIFNE